MIIEMTRARVIGPKVMLKPTIAALQDLGVLHVSATAHRDRLHPHSLSDAERARERRVRRALDAVEDALAQLARLSELPSVEQAEVRPGEGAAALAAHRLGARLAVLDARRAALVEEREALELYRPLFDEFDALLRAAGNHHRFSAYLLLLRASTRVEDLERALDQVAGRDYELRARPLSGGGTALLLLVPRGTEQNLEDALSTVRVDSAPIPGALRGANLIDALPRMRPRLAEVNVELDEVRDEARALRAEHGPVLESARRALHDELTALAAALAASETARAFVLEGWVPSARFDDMTARLNDAVGDRVSVRAMGRDEWSGEEAPVVLTNPRVFAPFERITSMVPLPRYGTFDPTPFVAVFFPMLFGVVVGDVGYGALMALIAGLLRWRAPPASVRRDVSRIAGAVATFTIVFGVLYGELFGDLGRSLIGMRPVWLHREEAVIPFLVLALFLGLGHLFIGLVLSVLSHRRSQPRVAIGRGISLLMLALIVVALMTVFDLLPGALFTPSIVALLIAFPVLVAVEGFSGMFEFLTVFGHILSYARVMAIGTASVMLAVVANRMAGAFGSAAIGIVFALLFHLVNFAIALFSPTIHVLRLHYVEFFSTFFSPGGERYKPLAHWKPADQLAQ